MGGGERRSFRRQAPHALLESALLSPLLTSDPLTWGNGGLAALQLIPPFFLAASIAQCPWTCWLSLGSSSAKFCLAPEDSWTPLCLAMTYLAGYRNPGPKPRTLVPSHTLYVLKKHVCHWWDVELYVLMEQQCWANRLNQWETPSVRDYRIHCYKLIQWNILEPFTFRMDDFYFIRVDDFYLKSLSMICPHP